METKGLLSQFLFWGIWLLIPLIWDICLEAVGTVIVIFKYMKKKEQDMVYYPEVSLLIPVYNSQGTLEMCLDSIASQSYPLDKMEVFLIDNGSRDNSYSIFEKFQNCHPRVKIWWYSTRQGKSKALNKGIFGSSSKYVVNIDSDGWLDKNAIENVVNKFESHGNISCMTGVVLIDPDLIEKTANPLMKAFRRCEFYEYIESFLVGRNHHSIFNSMYTLAGAFSCFRREVLTKTQMYNFETLGEDTHMTFQVRNFVGGKIVLCENAFFYVDPIESLDKLYIQRQRWQRGELEVARLFDALHMGGPGDFLKKFTMRILVSDHTLAFPRLIWFFAMIYLYFINYPLKLLLGANLLMYAAYGASCLVYLGVAGLYLKGQEEVKKYAYKHWYTCLMMPVYKFAVYWARVAGIINSARGESRWRVRTLSEEVEAVGKSIAEVIKKRFPWIEILRRAVNNE